MWPAASRARAWPPQVCGDPAGRAVCEGQLAEARDQAPSEGSLGLPTFCSSTLREQCARGPVQPEDAPGSACPAHLCPTGEPWHVGKAAAPGPGGRGCAALSGTAASYLSSSSPWQRQWAPRPVPPSAEAGPACPQRPQGSSCLPPAGCRGPGTPCLVWAVAASDGCVQTADLGPPGPECSHGSDFLYLPKFYLKLFYVLGHFPAPSL